MVFIAQLNGGVIGSAVSIAMACDFRLGNQDVWFWICLLYTSLLDEKKTIRGYRIGGSGCRHGDVVKEMMKEIRRETGCLDAGEDLIVGTGYGRRNIPGVQYTYTEITCHAKGSLYCPVLRYR